MKGNFVHAWTEGFHGVIFTVAGNDLGGLRCWKMSVTNGQIVANGQEIPARFPCTIEEFLIAQNLLPRSVVVEHNGQAVAPSEFSRRPMQSGDRLEIVKIVAGG